MVFIHLHRLYEFSQNSQVPEPTGRFLPPRNQVFIIQIKPPMPLGNLCLQHSEFDLTYSIRSPSGAYGNQWSINDALSTKMFSEAKRAGVCRCATSTRQR